MNIKEVEALCYAIIANASELDVLDGSMTLLNDVIECIKLNIENEKEEEDFKKLQKAYDLLLEVKSSLLAVPFSTAIFKLRYLE